MFDETHYYITRLLEGADDRTINSEIIEIRARTEEEPSFLFTSIGLTEQGNRAIFQRSNRSTNEVKGFILKIVDDEVELLEIK